MSPLPSFQAGDVRTRQPAAAASKVNVSAASNGQSIDVLQHTPAASPLLRALPASSASSLSATSLSSVTSTPSSASHDSPLLLLLVFVLAAIAVVVLIRTLPPLTASDRTANHSHRTIGTAAPTW